MKPHQEQKRKVTAVDVARDAAVSQSTVSRVLNNRDTGFISATTRKKVLEAAARLDYAPNPFAQALREGRTHLIGLVLRDIGDPMHAKLVSQISVMLRRAGYHLIIIQTQSDPEQALEMRSVLNARHADGVIILGDLPNGQEALEKIVEANHAVVSMYRRFYPGIGRIVTVASDTGVALALDHLRSLGHRRVGFIGYDWLDDVGLRKDAFVQSYDQFGIESRPEWLVMNGDGIEGGYGSMRRILSLPQRPSAIIACDDEIALGAIRAIAEAGLRIPQDISIVGFDDIPMAKYSNPPLTTLRMPVSEICRKTCDVLLKLISGRMASKSSVFKVKPSLIVRSSTGPTGAVVH